MTRSIYRIEIYTVETILNILWGGKKKSIGKRSHRRRTAATLHPVRARLGNPTNRCDRGVCARARARRFVAKGAHGAARRGAESARAHRVSARRKQSAGRRGTRCATGCARRRALLARSVFFFFFIRLRFQIIVGIRFFFLIFFFRINIFFSLFGFPSVRPAE